MRTFSRIIDSSTDSQFICRWNGRDTYENQRASQELETAYIKCGRSASNLQAERKLGSATIKGGKAKVSCVCNDLQKWEWRPFLHSSYDLRPFVFCNQKLDSNNEPSISISRIILSGSYKQPHLVKSKQVKKLQTKGRVTRKSILRADPNRINGFGFYVPQ